MEGGEWIFVGGEGGWVGVVVYIDQGFDVMDMMIVGERWMFGGGRKIFLHCVGQ